MNKVQLVGRLTKDPEMSVFGQSQTPYVKFTVAVDRRFKDQNGNRLTDFIPCVAWKTTAQFIGNYFRKGMKIGVSGSIQTRNYENQQGQKVYVTEINVDEAEFVESKNEQPSAPAPVPIAPPMPTVPPVQQIQPAAPAAPAPAPIMDLRPRPQMENVSLQDLEQFGQLPFEL